MLQWHPTQVPVQLHDEQRNRKDHQQQWLEGQTDVTSGAAQDSAIRLHHDR